MKRINPFILSGYKSAKYFCNRKDETKKLISAVNNGRNVTMFSLRRMGKTGLIYHLFDKLSKQDNYSLIYCDLFQTQNVNEFVQLFSNVVLKSLVSKPEQFYKNTIELFKSIRPKISADTITGQPYIEFSLDKKNDLTPALSELTGFIKEKSGKQKIIIAFDEFQQIAEYPEQKTEAVLRAFVQELPDVRFIYSGSRKHLLYSIFSDTTRPFYQSSEVMNLNRINRNEYSEFIQEKFSEVNINITNDAINFILDYTKQYTYYVQLLCNKLFSSYTNNITIDDAANTADSILEESESYYTEIKNYVTVLQWNILKAIAKEGGIRSITSMSFINKYGLTAPSSVSTAVKILQEKELIYFENGIYYVYDLFFSKWLEKLI